MVKTTDWCTRFPEYWYQWYIGRFYIPMLRKVYIGDECEKHDNVEGTGCASHAFAKGLWNKRVIGGVLIFSIASIACWVKYSKEMWRKL